MNIDLLEQRSVSLLQANAPADGSKYIGRFSGGKDSECIKRLAQVAGVPVEWWYSLTTIDPPEVVQHIKKNHPDVKIFRPVHGNLLHRALEKGWPAPTSRWCCDEYKEHTLQTSGSTSIIGVRIAESPRRKDKWPACVSFREHTHEKDTGSQKLVLPIRLWSDENVWEYIRTRGIKYCSLYDEGFKRLGCVGCPLVHRKQKEREFARWPKLGAAWRRMFERLWEQKAGTVCLKGKNKGREWWGSRVHDDVDELWEWWMDRCPNVTEWREKRGLRIKDVRVEG